MRAAVFIFTLGVMLYSPLIVVAHDTWVQTNTNVIRVGDAMHIDLMLGNHGNDHRDFKLAGKVGLKGCSLQIIAPNDKKYDLLDRLIDVGYTPNEGYWTTRFIATEPGVYTVSQTLDQIMSYAPVRAIKSAKTCFVVSEKLDSVLRNQPGFDRSLGHALELVPQSSPVAPMGPGVPISVKLLLHGKPLSDTTISFIPRGETLAAGSDDRFERMTDASGVASFTPTTGNYYLVVAHREEPSESGDGYDRTKYSATVTVFVPETCSCCIE